VILVDANILIYASVDRFVQHERALRWLNEQLNGTERVGLPWESTMAFARVATNPRALPNPISTTSAWGQIREWLSRPMVWIPKATEQHAEVLQELLLLPGVASKLVMDAHLAALAIEHGLTLCSADTDFARFRKLKWENPLG
jgi:toxin-antitoxin system PIN domain toxin